MGLFDHFADEAAAQAYLESHVWPEGAQCPHCGEPGKLGRLNGISTPLGSFKCYSCRRRFTLRHGTIFGNSHVPLHIWLRAIYLLAASDHRWGAPRLSRGLGVSLRTAWHLKLKVLQAVADARSDDMHPKDRHPKDMHSEDPHADDAASDDAKNNSPDHQAACCAMTTDTFGTDTECVDANSNEPLRSRDVHTDLRLRMFHEAAARLPAAGAERRFAELVNSVVRPAQRSSAQASSTGIGTQLSLWNIPDF